MNQDIAEYVFISILKEKTLLNADLDIIDISVNCFFISICSNYSKALFFEMGKMYALSYSPISIGLYNYINYKNLSEYTPDKDLDKKLFNLKDRLKNFIINSDDNTDKLNITMAIDNCIKILNEQSKNTFFGLDIDSLRYLATYMSHYTYMSQKGNPEMSLEFLKKNSRPYYKEISGIKINRENILDRILTY